MARPIFTCACAVFIGKQGHLEGGDRKCSNSGDLYLTEIVSILSDTVYVGSTASRSLKLTRKVVVENLLQSTPDFMHTSATRWLLSGARYWFGGNIYLGSDHRRSLPIVSVLCQMAPLHRKKHPVPQKIQIFPAN